ncbi:MAG: flagellar hook assembly protein FlgD [Aeromonadaceae bacterium]
MSIYSNLGLSTNETATAAAAKSASAKNSGALSQSDFLSLLTTQLAYQDPTKPVDNAEMVSQMAQISTVDGIASLNQSVTSLSSSVTSSQALIASSLVGQKVLLPTNTGYLAKDGSMDGVLATGTGASDLKVTIQNANGEVVHSYSIPGTQSGNVPFSWDGKNSNGEAMPEGKYTVKVNGLVNGKSQELSGLVYGKVNSVTLGSSSTATSLNLSGLGSIELSKVLEVSK